MAVRGHDGRYGLVLRFRPGGVPYGRWQEKQDRLGRFFAKGLEARLSQPAAGEVLLELLPAGALSAGPAAEPDPDPSPAQP